MRWFGKRNVKRDSKAGANTQDILGLVKEWMSLFGGKPNTQEVLLKKAEALAWLVVLGEDSQRDLASKLANVPKGGEQAKQVFIETMMLTLHFADRVASQYLPEPERAFFIDCLIENTVSVLAQRKRIGIGTPAFQALATDTITTFNDRQIEYGNYKLPSRPGEPAKDMLFWEFGKKIAHTLGADKDPAMIIPVERFAVDTMVSLHLRELLLGETGA
jgi:hypothetical protein